MSRINKQPYLLSNPIQHYLWGSKGKNAYIPSLLGFEPEDDLPYAELWIGAHPKASSKVKISGSSIQLDKFVKDHPVEILGNTVANKYGGKFPFLLKILSAENILSIQVHPNKRQAISLFSEDPLHYSDDNHKPELAIALDSLTALIGFIDVDQINLALVEYPELKDVVSEEIIKKVFQKNSSNRPLNEDRTFSSFFSAYLRDTVSTRDKIINSTSKLHDRLKNKPLLTEKETLFDQLYPVYPGDVGLWLIFLMNLVHLSKNQAIFIGAGILHAYIRGNIVECMANSDNVVRVGLTEKFKDTKTLTRIVNFGAQPNFVAEQKTGSEIIYTTPAEEFQVSRIDLDQTKIEITIEDNGPVVLFILRGVINVSWKICEEEVSQEFHQGQAVLIPAFINAIKVNCKESAELIKASVPSEKFC